MTYRFLGRSGLQVSSIALGGWLTYGGHVDKREAFPIWLERSCVRVLIICNRGHLQVHESRL